MKGMSSGGIVTKGRIMLRSSCSLRDLVRNRSSQVRILSGALLRGGREPASFAVSPVDLSRRGFAGEPGSGHEESVHLLQLDLLLPLEDGNGIAVGADHPRSPSRAILELLLCFRTDVEGPLALL
jgi:hypothetical protein